MDTKKGIIESKSITGTGSGPKGSWTRHEYIISGQKYSSFDKKLFEDINIGDYVEMEGEQNGAFWNMKGMKKINKEDILNGVPEIEYKKIQEVTPVKDAFKKHDSTLRVDCLNIAVEEYKTHKTMVTAKLLIEEAEELFNYVTNGL